MWIIFRKSDRKVVGISADSEIDLEKAEALTEVVRGLATREEGEEFDAIQVADREQGWAVARALGRGEATVVERAGGGFEITEETPEETAVTITTDATQFHPVDRSPLLSADGTSFLVVTLQKVSLQGTPLTREAIDNEEIWLRTTCGSLREDPAEPTSHKSPSIPDPEGPKEIRSVTLAGGTARFRLYSENVRRLANVEMLSVNRELHLGSLRVEFI